MLLAFSVFNFAVNLSSLERIRLEENAAVEKL